MVWAEMVMGQNGHGPKWLWAEMTSDLIKSSVLVTGVRVFDIYVFHVKSINIHPFIILELCFMIYSDSVPGFCS